MNNKHKSHIAILYNRSNLTLFVCILLIVLLSYGNEIYSQFNNSTLSLYNPYKYKSNSSFELQNKFSSKKYNAQIPVSKAEFILNPIVGGILPFGDLTGDLSSVSLYNDASLAKGYFEKWGFTLGLIGKLPAGKNGNIRPMISIIYNGLLNSGTDSTGQITIEPSIHILQIGLGIEYVIMKQNDFLPFVEADFYANFLSGSITYTENTGNLSFEENYNRNLRYGFGAGAGVEYQINKTFSLIGGVKFNYVNLFGKDSDNTGAHDFNDAAFTVNGFSINQKLMMFASAYFGVSLNIRD